MPNVLVGVRLMVGVVILLSNLQISWTFRWHVQEELPSHKYFTFSERYMFADRKGPTMLEQGPSYIHVETQLDIYTLVNNTVDVGLAIFAASEGHHHSDLVGMCEEDTARLHSNTWASQIEIVMLETKYVRSAKLQANNNPLGLNGTYFIRTVHIDYQYIVKEEAWHNVVFLICPPSYQLYPTTSISSSRNHQLLLNGNSQLKHTYSSPQAPATVGTARTAADGGTGIAVQNHWDAWDGGGGSVVPPALRTSFSTRTSSTTTTTNSAATSSARTTSSLSIQQLAAAATASKATRPSSAHEGGGGGGGGSALDPIGYIHGRISFRNPHGFLPAELFALLPFEGARMTAYVLFSLFFAWFYCRYSDSVLPLHKGFLLVFATALAEATLWYASYQSVNLSGQPYCCPFPAVVIASLILQVFRQTLARSLLLVVCLGYGIVRPKLMINEWFAVVVVTALYFLSALVSQVADILMGEDVHGGSSSSAGDSGIRHGNDRLRYRIAEVFLDIVFLSWIYLAITSTIRILREFQQTVKLEMYQQLVSIIGIFVLLFTVATIIFIINGLTVEPFVPWQWTAAEQVTWESLNFAVLAAVCIVCRPCENSRFLSYASQLPMEDPDDEEGERGGGSTSLYDSDEEEEKVNSSSQSSSQFYDVGRSRQQPHQSVADRDGGADRGAGAGSISERSVEMVVQRGLHHASESAREHARIAASVAVSAVGVAASQIGTTQRHNLKQQQELVEREQEYGLRIDHELGEDGGENYREEEVDAYIRSLAK